MNETDSTQTNLENDNANLEDLSLPIITEQILPKRIRKRIKYYRKAVDEMPLKFAILQPDDKDVEF